LCIRFSIFDFRFSISKLGGVMVDVEMVDVEMGVAMWLV